MREQGHQAGRGAHSHIGTSTRKRPPSQFGACRVAVHALCRHRLGCGWGGGAQIRWRLRSNEGARRLGFRLDGGAAQVSVAVQRRLGWRRST